jgi:putative transposase
MFCLGAAAQLFAAQDRSNSHGYPDATTFGRERSRVTARSLLCYWVVPDLGLSMAELSRRLGLSLSGLSQSVKRGEKLAQDKGYKLIDH